MPTYDKVATGSKVVVAHFFAQQSSEGATGTSYGLLTDGGASQQNVTRRTLVITLLMAPCLRGSC